MIKNNKKYKIISDHLGSPVMIVDSSNNVVKEIKYDTFGNVVSDSAPAFELPFRFAGGIWDEDTKLIRFGVRDYDPEVGRWTSKEPLGFSGARSFRLRGQTIHIPETSEAVTYDASIWFIMVR